jgi:hypothetical protein
MPSTSSLIGIAPNRVSPSTDWSYFVTGAILNRVSSRQEQSIFALEQYAASHTKQRIAVS